jgi:hypothetical protein
MRLASMGVLAVLVAGDAARHRFLRRLFFAHDGRVPFLWRAASQEPRGRGSWVVEVDLNGNAESIDTESFADTRE